MAPNPDSNPEVPIAGIAANIWAAWIQRHNTKDQSDTVSLDDHQHFNNKLEKHSAVFSGIGLLRNEELHFHINHSVPPVAAPYRPIPLAYQEKLSAHLQELWKVDKIEDVKPQDHSPRALNVVITEKKQTGKIRMNTDMRQANHALACNAPSNQDPSQIHHKLKRATRFSEIDMSHGYHQIGLSWLYINPWQYPTLGKYPWRTWRELRQMPNMPAGERSNTLPPKMHLWSYLCVMVWNCVQQVRHDPRKINTIQEAGRPKAMMMWKVFFMPASSMQGSCSTQQVPTQGLLRHYET